MSIKDDFAAIKAFVDGQPVEGRLMAYEAEWPPLPAAELRAAFDAPEFQKWVASNAFDYEPGDDKPVNYANGEHTDAWVDDEVRRFLLAAVRFMAFTPLEMAATAGAAIKPCPWCASPGKVIAPMGFFVGKGKGHNGGYYSAPGSRIICSADDCRASGKPFYGPDQDAEAIAWWNKRAPADQPPAAQAPAIPAGMALDAKVRTILLHSGVHEDADTATGLVPYPVAARAVRDAFAAQEDATALGEVERLRAFIHNDALLFAQIETRMRDCWIGTGKLSDDGSASNDFRVWMNEAHNRQRDLKAALGINPSAALSTPPRRVDDAGLREAVEAFDALLATHTEDAGMDDHPDEDSVGWYQQDGITRELPLTFGILRRARKAAAALATHSAPAADGAA